MSVERIRAAIEAVLPALAFTLVVTLHGSLLAAVIVAVALTLAFTIGHLLSRRRSLRPLIGLALLAPAALTALLSGSAVGFFLPEIVLTAVAVVVAVILQVAGLPPAGVLASLITGSTMDWRRCRRRRRAYSVATVLLLAIAILVMAIQLPLVLAGAVGLLGIARPVLLLVNGLGFLLAFRVYQRMAGDHVCDELSCGFREPVAAADH